jgi:hypothetical protein
VKVFKKEVVSTMIVFPPREKFHAWSAGEAERRQLAVEESEKRSGVSWSPLVGWAVYDRRCLLMLLREILREKCVIMGCPGKGLQIDELAGSDGCWFRIVAGTWPKP